MYLDDGVLKSALFMMAPLVLNLEAIGYVRNQNMFACPVPPLSTLCFFEIRIYFLPHVMAYIYLSSMTGVSP